MRRLVMTGRESGLAGTAAVYTASREMGTKKVAGGECRMPRAWRNLAAFPFNLMKSA